MSVIKGIDLPINNLWFKYSHILVLYNQLSNTEQTNMEMIHTEHAVKKNEGRWTTEENYLFDKYIELALRKDWPTMSNLIPTRTEDQIRSHAQKMLGKEKARLSNPDRLSTIQDQQYLNNLLVDKASRSTRNKNLDYSKMMENPPIVLPSPLPVLAAMREEAEEFDGAKEAVEVEEAMEAMEAMEVEKEHKEADNTDYSHLSELKGPKKSKPIHKLTEPKKAASERAPSEKAPSLKSKSSKVKSSQIKRNRVKPSGRAQRVDMQTQMDDQVFAYDQCRLNESSRPYSSFQLTQRIARVNQNSLRISPKSAFSPFTFHIPAVRRYTLFCSAQPRQLPQPAEPLCLCKKCGCGPCQCEDYMSFCNQAPESPCFKLC